MTHSAPAPQAKRIVNSGAHPEKDFKLSKLSGFHQNPICSPSGITLEPVTPKRLYEPLGE